MSGQIHIAIAAMAMAATLAASPALAMGVLPNCLDDLSEQTERWSACTHRYSRSARECRQSTADMWSLMQRCERKGYSKQEIDAAMAKGASRSGGGEQPLNDIEPAPLPKARPGPIPGVKLPPTGSG